MGDEWSVLRKLDADVHAAHSMWTDSRCPQHFGHQTSQGACTCVRSCKCFIYTCACMHTMNDRALHRAGAGRLSRCGVVREAAGAHW